MRFRIIFATLPTFTHCSVCNISFKQCILPNQSIPLSWISRVLCTFRVKKNFYPPPPHRVLCKMPDSLGYLEWQNNTLFQLNNRFVSCRHSAWENTWDEGKSKFHGSSLRFLPYQLDGHFLERKEAFLILKGIKTSNFGVCKGLPFLT